MRFPTFILWLIAFLATDCIAYGNNGQDKNTLAELYRLIPNSIDRIENDRIFFNPSKVTFFEGQYYIEGIPFTTVHSDESGIYLSMCSRPSSAEERAIYICTKCTLLHYYRPTICERPGCGNRDFIVRYK